MDKELLIKVLSTSSRVVLPGFGAFLRKVQGEQLIFSPFLKGDDGFLNSFVAQEYGVSQEDATTMVAAFVEHIREVLSAKNKFYINGVGTLLVDDNGSIAMVMDTSRQIGAAPAHLAPPVEPIALVQQPVQPLMPHPISSPRTQFTPPQPAPQPIRPMAPAPQVGGFARAASSSTPPIASQPQGQPQGQAQGQSFRPNPMVARTEGMPANLGNITNQTMPGPADASHNPQGVPQNRAHGEQGARPNGGQRPVRRPVSKGGKKAKGDLWLVIAIVAALVVIGLIIYGILTAQAANNLQL